MSKFCKIKKEMGQSIRMESDELSPLGKIVNDDVFFLKKKQLYWR